MHRQREQLVRGSGEWSADYSCSTHRARPSARRAVTAEWHVLVAGVAVVSHLCTSRKWSTVQKVPFTTCLPHLARNVFIPNPPSPTCLSFRATPRAHLRYTPKGERDERDRVAPNCGRPLHRPHFVEPHTNPALTLDREKGLSCGRPPPPATHTLPETT